MQKGRVKNIAFFSDSYEPQINGVVTQLNNLLEGFSKKGYRVMLVAPSPDSKFRQIENHGAKIFLLPSIALPTYEDYRITNFISNRIFREIAGFGPDIIHCHTPFGVGWIGIQAGKKLNVPVVGTYHTLLPEFLMYLPIPGLKTSKLAKGLAWKYTNMFYGNCAVVTTPTGPMKKELESNGLKNVHALPNAIDFDNFYSARKKNYAAKKPRLIYFGRVSYEKNIEVLIYALKKLLSKGVLATLTITGSGPALESLKNIAKEEKISEFMVFTGPKDHMELPKFVSGHDVFVTASTIETQGLTILESMACGLPCVCANARAIPDSVKEGFNGYLFEPFDSDGCAQKLGKLSKSPALRKKMGQNSIKTAKKFSLNAVISETVELYNIAASK